VFVDGCFWHGCPTHHTTAKANGEYWSSKVRRNRERDAETTAVLQEHGWTVLRFWEHEDLRASAREVATVYHGLRESHSHDTALAAAAARTHLQGSIRIGSQVTELGSGGSNER
jgi:G:T-mismatch repair DNA endonuclease (very short patch repair protein)